MSATATQRLAVESSTPKFRPQDNIFRSFNVLTTDISENLVINLKTIRKGDMSEYITESPDVGNFKGRFVERSSSIENMEAFSASAGINGKYGLYSASVKVSSESTETSTLTTLYVTYIGQMLMSRISLNALSKEKMLELLEPRMVDQLKKISSLAHARDFTNEWGTHLVTEVHTG